MSEELGPALTAEEWGKRAKHVRPKAGSPTAFAMEQAGCLYVADQGGESSQDIVPELRHALAALCLYGQPFGFWPELPFTLRTAAERLRTLENSHAEEAWVDLDRAADLIAALLPPREA